MYPWVLQSTAPRGSLDLAQSRSTCQMTTVSTLPAPAYLADDGSQIPMMPSRINMISPTMAELTTFAAWLKDLANGCNVAADCHQPRNPFATMGALRVGTEM